MSTWFKWGLPNVNVYLHGGRRVKNGQNLVYVVKKFFGPNQRYRVNGILRKWKLRKWKPRKRRITTTQWNL